MDRIGIYIYIYKFQHIQNWYYAQVRVLRISSSFDVSDAQEIISYHLMKNIFFNLINVRLNWTDAI